MNSMTGYAYKEFTNGDTTVSVEIKGYNNRFLDISVYLPSWLGGLEIGIREYLSSCFVRGKIDINIKLKEKNPDISVSLNENAVRAYETAIVGLSKILGISTKPGIDVILGLEGVFETETKRELENYRSIIDPVFVSAVDQFKAERAREGKHTADDIFSHVAVLEESVKKINEHAPELEELIKDNLRKRFVELLGDKIDENRILAETAVLLVKYTISEELSRLSSHLEEFRLESGRNPSPGKKLDFLSQEINREINTIGSKTTMLEVSREVVEMKNALENIREQLRNVE